MMITTANIIGRATSFVAVRTDSSGGSSGIALFQAMDGVLS